MKTQILTDTGLKVYDQEMKNFIDKKLEYKVDAEVGKGLSTNDYNDEEKNTVAQNKEDIEEIKRQMESYETENEDIVNTTESTLENSYEGGLVINEMYGKTEQNAYTGKNLFSMRKSNTTSNGISVTVDNENQSFSVSGTATANTSISITDNYDEIKEKIANGGTFTMSLVNATFDSAKCNISLAYGYNGTTYWIKANGESVTVPNGSTMYSIGLYVPSGTNANLSNVKIQLEENTVATEWEPYVGGKPSPSSSYQQEIKRVVLNTIKTRTTNLIDMSNPLAVTNMSYNDDTKTYVQTATDTSTGFLLYIRQLKAYNDTTDYKWVYDGNITTAQTISCTFTKLSGYNAISIKHNGQAKDVGVFLDISNLKDGATYYFKMNIVNATQGSIEFGEIIISETESDYVPYQSSEITLSEPIELNGFNGVYDVVTSDGVTRRFAKVVFDGSEDELWRQYDGWLYSQALISTIKIPTTQDILPNVLCSMAKVVSRNDLPNSKDSMALSTNGNLNIYNNYYQDVEVWKTFLQSNPMTVVYELATPTTEELPIVDQIALHSIRTFNGTTYIETDSEVQPIFDVDYGCSQVGATALESHNNIEINRIIASSLSPGNSITYELSKENNKIVLTGSDGSKTSVNDDNTVYTHPTTSGNKHIPSGGSSGQILRWSADGTAVWGNDNNIEIDTTLTKSGKAADAKVVGDSKVDYSDIVNNLSTAVAVTDTQTPVGCGTVKEINQKMLQIVSFDPSTGTLTTKSYDYTG